MYDPKKQLPIENKVNNTPDPHQLVPTDRIIQMAKRLGISFGHGDPSERIRYYTKLGILPHQIRKSVIGNSSSGNSKNQKPHELLPISATSSAGSDISEERRQHSMLRRPADINNSQISGHLPYWVIKRLIVVDRLKRSGASFQQIAEKFKRIDNRIAKDQANQNIPSLTPKPQTTKPAIASILQTSLALWTKMGLSEEEIEQRLAKHKAEIERKLQEHKREIKKELGITSELTDTRDIIKSLSESDLNSLTGYRNYLKKDPEPNIPDAEALKMLSGKIVVSDEESPTDDSQSTIDSHGHSLWSSDSRFADLTEASPTAGSRDPRLLEIDYRPHTRYQILVTRYSLAFASFLIFAIVLSILQSPSVKQALNRVNLDRANQIASETSENSKKLGAVLAASSEANKLYIDATTEFLGETTFIDPITAPNIIYGLTGGTGITVTAGQNPTVSLDATEIVTTLNSTSGALTIAGSGGTSISTSGSTITISSSSSSSGDITAVNAGNGLTGGASSGDASLAISLTSSGTTTTTSSASGLQFSSGLSLLRGCSNTQTLQWVAATATWDCATGGGGISGSGTAGRVAYWSDSSTLSSNANFINFSSTLFSNVGQISLGSAVQSTGTAFVVVDNPAITATSNQNFYKAFIDNSAAVTITGSTTSSIVASLAIDEPNITATGTATNAVTLYISGAPTEGSSGNFALWVDDGESRFESTPVAGSTTGSAVTIVPTYVVEATDITLSGIRLALDSNSNADSGDVFYGLNVDDFTTTSGPTEYGVRIGSGYDYQFYFELGTRDLRLSATAPSAGTSPLTATIPALAADDTFCFATLANCFGAGGGAGVTYTSQVTNALTKFTATTGQITSSGITDDGSTLTLPANRSLTLTAGTGSIAENFSPAGTTGTANALTVTPTFGIDVTDQTLSGLYVNPNTNTNTDTGDILNGILIDTITASSATEYGLQIGSGYDQNLYLNDTSTNVLLADGGTITIGDGTNTLCTLTDAGTTGNLSCTGNLTGGSGGTVGFWSRTSTTLSPSTANDIVSIANTNTTGADLAITNTGVYTGTGMVNLTADSATAGTILALSADALTTGKGIDLTSTANALDSATLLNVAHTATAATDTTLSADIANLSFAPTYSTAVTTPAISGQVLDISRTITTNSLFASTLTVSGALVTISDTATQTTGTLTHTANLLDLTQNYTSSTGTALYVKNYGAPLSTSFRVDDVSGDTTPFIIDSSGQVGIGDSTPSSLVEIGDGTDSIQFATNGDITFVDDNNAANINGPSGGNLNINGMDSNVGGRTVAILGGSGLSGATGGPVTLTGGPGSLSAAGGAVNITSGAGGATGTAGNVVINVGTSNSGNGTISIGTAARAQTITIGNTSNTQAITFDSATTTANTVAINNAALTSGNLLDLSNTSTVSAGSDLIQGDHTATYVTTVSLTGNMLDLSRALTTNTGGALTVSGALASLTDNCTQTAGTCTNTANILSLSQSYASASGAVLNIANSGTGADIAFNTTPTLTIGDGGTLTFTDGTNTLCSIADGGSQGNLTCTGTLSLGTNESINASITLFSSGVGETDPTIVAEADGDLTLSAATGTVNVGSGTGDITLDPGANNLLANLSSTGDFLIQDAGTAYVTFSDTGTTTFDFTGTTTVGVTVNANSLTSGTALALASTATAFNGELLTLSKTAATGSTAFTSDITNVTYSQTFNATVASASTGNVLDISRAYTVDDSTAGAISATISGAVVTISDNCTQGTADTCTHSGNVLSLTQSYASASGAVLSITGSGTGSTISATGNSVTTGSGISGTFNGLTTGTGLDISSTGTITTTGELAAFTANSLTTGALLRLSATALSSGTGIEFTGPSATGITGNVISLTSDVGSAGELINLAPDFSGAGVTGAGITLAGTDSTSSGNTNYGYQTTLTLTGNAPKTAVDYLANLSTASTTADTLAAFDTQSTDWTTAAAIITTGTRNVYGLRSQPLVGAESTGGTTNVYGVYSKASGDVGVGGTINNYGVYVANGTYDTDGTSTAYGLYIENITGADTNYAAYLNGDVVIGKQTDSGGTTADWTKDSQTTAGTIASAGTASIDNAYSMAVYNGSLYVGTGETNAAEVYRYDGGTTWTKVSQATAGTIASGGTASIIGVYSMAVYNGSLYVGTGKTDAAEIYRYDGGTTWTKVSQATAGTIASGGTASINMVFSMAVYNGSLYAGTNESLSAEIYRYDGGTTWTKVSQATAGTIASGGTASISGIPAMNVYRNLLYLGTSKTNAAEVYHFTAVEGQSFALKFNAASDNANAEQNNLLNFGSISFLAEQQALNNKGNFETGTFLFSHGIATETGAYDIAEDYPTRDENLQAGDLVSVDTNEAGFVKIAQGRYNNHVLGVYSEKPGLRLSQKDAQIEDARAVPIALAGRVPVKVSTENGPIKAGDSITSSSTPGVGMRATQPGRVIGIALETFSCSSEIIDNSSESNTSTNYELSTQNCEGKILVFVNPTFYMGSALALDEWSILANQSLSRSEQLNQEATSLHDLLAEDIARAETLLAELENKNVPTEEEIASLVKDEVNKQLISLGYVDYEATGSAQATSSALLAAQTNKTLSDLDALLQTTNYSLPTLTVTGNTQLAQTQIAGTLSQDGTLIIDYGKQINVLGSTLYLQNDSLAGCQASPFTSEVGYDSSEVGCKNGVLLDIGSGLFTFDDQGNLVATGNIEAKGLVLSESITASTIGSSQIPANQKQVTIYTSALKPGAKVLVTATGPTGGKSLYLAGKQDYESFTVAIENGPATQNINFDWLIINTTQVSSN